MKMKKNKGNSLNYKPLFCYLSFDVDLWSETCMHVCSVYHSLIKTPHKYAEEEKWWELTVTFILPEKYAKTHFFSFVLLFLLVTKWQLLNLFSLNCLHFIYNCFNELCVRGGMMVLWHFTGNALLFHSFLTENSSWHWIQDFYSYPFNVETEIKLFTVICVSLINAFHFSKKKVVHTFT